ncbi:putative nucleoside transporter protein [Xylaria intraflava]|nr:putative nucleoside transporter protein [Xylaria intraflava]
MDRLRSLFRRGEDNGQEYQPLYEDGDPLAPESNEAPEVPFSWIEYGIFLMLGIAALWAWNMFVAAAPYFQFRFQMDDWILQNFQSAIISVYTLTTLSSMAILAGKQDSASYPFRISSALYLTAVVFLLLTISSKAFLDVTATTYFAFLLAMVALAAFACGLLQNGALTLASSFKRPEYLQAIMAGQGIAGVLPSLVQVISILVASSPNTVTEEEAAGPDKGTAAFIYFLTAVVISVVALLSFGPLIHRYNKKIRIRTPETMAEDVTASMTSTEAADFAQRRVVSMTTLFRKLYWLATAVFICFAVTMLFPVFTPKILSVVPPEKGGALLQPAAFVPLAFFFWNIGDLAGRSLSLFISLQHRPVILFIISIARSVFLPLYLLCNINNRGAVVNSDLFYLLLVQLPFGLTNGWLGSNCMMAAGKWVDETEREASGGFMGVCLVAGLSAGSLLSFVVAGI